MKEQKKVPAFGIKDKVGYMFGDFGNDFTFILDYSRRSRESRLKPHSYCILIEYCF